MTQEEKDLLFKDLCARLPYSIKLHHYQGADCTLKYFNPITFATYVEVKNSEYFKEYLEDGQRSLFEYKPYLRPMSSMTENERNDFYKHEGVMSYCLETDTWALTAFTINGIDWLNAHHFDYRGLIKRGLALEASEEMYTVDV